MPYYLIHNSDGNILRSVNCDDGEIALNTGSGETALEWPTILDIEQYWIDGVTPTAIPTPNPEPGTTRYYWDTILLTWVDRYTNQQRETLQEQTVYDQILEALIASDWTQLPDAPLSATQKTAWATYRQALRDLPDQEAWPLVTWPQKPA
jgi:hypothetical protein